MVLGRARAGADLAAVVSFHDALTTKSPKSPAEKGKGKARVLVFTGAVDPMVPPEQVEAFNAEMTAAGAKFRVVSYQGARHSFTNPDADKAGMDALAYNAEAGEKSWAAMLDLFKEVLR